jgi:hypothetical protein
MSIPWQYKTGTTLTSLKLYIRECFLVSLTLKLSSDLVCEEFVTFLDEFTIFSVFLTISRVGLSALLSHVMSVWVSTEVKTDLVTMAYDF